MQKPGGRGVASGGYGPGTSLTEQTGSIPDTAIREAKEKPGSESLPGRVSKIVGKS
jgi:hypothetical protein